MEVEVNKRQIESIESPGAVDKILGLSSARSERGWIKGRIQVFRNRKNWEMVNIFESFLKVHNKFHPELKATVDIFGWKGKSGFEVKSYPNYFEVREWRKLDKDSKPKRMKHKIYKESINKILKAISKLLLNRKYKTRTVAQIWAKENEIWKNNDGKRIFDEEGFNFANISGCRQTYFDFYYSLKVLEFYQNIKYYKSGHIARLKKDLKIQTEFTK